MISIALATYNGARYIREQLDSFAAQTNPPIELVITDDGSTDNTLAIVEDFARTAPFPVHVHRNDARLGYRANFMKCAGLCRGDLIAFSDQDDVWLNHKLAKQRKHFDDGCVYLSCHNANLIDSDGRTLGRDLKLFPRSQRLSIQDTSPFWFAQGFTQLIRRDLLSFSHFRARSIDIADRGETMAHDKWFFFLAIVFGLVEYDAEPLVFYRQHDSNTSGSVPTRRQKLVGKFSDRRAEYQRLVLVWKNRSDILHAILSNMSEHRETLFSSDTESRIKRASSMYLALCDATKRRRDFYNAESINAKVALFKDAFRSGDYKSGSPWRFGIGGAVRDFSMIAVPGKN